MPDLTTLGSWTPRTFFARFTEPEKTAIFAMARANDQMFRLLIEFAMSDRIRTDHPDLEPGMQALVTAGIITAERKVKILDVTNV